jgi:hypothetical protein
LCKLGFKKSEVEHAEYMSEGNSFLLVGVYVDDLIICGPNNIKISEFKQQMMQLFSMSDLGLLSYYLGLEMVQKPGEITICQSAYASKIIELCGMTGCNAVDTPIEQHVRLAEGIEEKTIDATKYRSIIGSLR